MRLLIARLNTLYPLSRDPTLLFPPLGEQTVAGLTPPEIDLDIQDEYVRHLDVSRCDAVAVAYHGFTSLPRLRRFSHECAQRELPLLVGGYFREQDWTLVRKEKISATLVHGEAEGIWPAVMADLQRGELRPVYKNGTFPDLTQFDEHLPRRNLTDNRHYTMSTVQTTKGCPYRCTFCQDIILHGFQVRSFSVARTLHEIEDCLTHPARIKNFFAFTDLNLAAKPAHKLELFSRVKDYGIAWGALSDISVAYNEKLLKVFAESGCVRLQIGFESVNEASLRAVNKPAFYKAKEYTACIKKIQDHGIGVAGCFIFGLDGDESGVARQTYDFIRDAGLDEVNVTKLLLAPDLEEYFRLKEEGRLTEEGFLPNRMSLDEVEHELRWAEDHYFSSPADRLRRRYHQGLRLFRHRHISLTTKLALVTHTLSAKLKMGFRKNLVHGYSPEGLDRIRA